MKPNSKSSYRSPELLSLSDEEFQRILKEMIHLEGVEEILSIGDVYPILAEHFNNDVIEEWESDYPEDYFELDEKTRYQIEIVLEHNPKLLPDNIKDQVEVLSSMDNQEIQDHPNSMSKDKSIEWLRLSLLDAVCSGDLDLTEDREEEM